MRASTASAGIERAAEFYQSPSLNGSLGRAQALSLLSSHSRLSCGKMGKRKAAKKQAPKKKLEPLGERRCPLLRRRRQLLQLLTLLPGSADLYLSKHVQMRLLSF